MADTAAAKATSSGTQGSTSQDAPNTVGGDPTVIGERPEGAQDAAMVPLKGAAAALAESPEPAKGDVRVRVMYPNDQFVAGDSLPAISAENSSMTRAQADAVAAAATASGVRVFINDEVFVPARPAKGTK